MDEIKPVEVIYIAGWGRSGSTLLDNVLGQLDGCLSCGELRYLWRRGLMENRLCGDGIAFRQHPFWLQVFEHAFGGMDKVPAVDALLRWEQKLLRTATMLPALALGRFPRLDANAHFYLDAMTKFYRSIAEVSGCRYIIDSSKNPLYAYWLTHAPGISLRVIHLTRDPRAVVYSWLRKKAQPDKDGMMDRHSMLRSVLHWRLANAAAARLEQCAGVRYRRLRYEDFVAQPRLATSALAAWLEITGYVAPFVGETEIAMRPNCAFSGNPSRFQSGTVTLRIDDEWRARMYPWRRALVGAIAGGALARYGYD